MAISDKITSIQDHLKDDWDSVESLIGDTELDKNIENISSALDDLYNDLPKVTGSGTSITLDYTRKGRLESTLSGNTSQTQYTGKNLLPPTIATETKNGITLTNNGDGSYTLTGTYSTSTTFDMALPATLNGTYSFSGNNPTAGKNIQFRIVASSGSSLSTYLNNVNKTVENKTIENGTKQSIRIVGSFTSGFTFKPQLESGSTATSYEPYVGGVATPNPTNPADVNVVSGDNEIVINGKNRLKLDFSNDSSTVAGLTFSHTDSTFSLSGTATSTYKIFNLTNIPNIISGETYTLSANVTGTNPRTQISIYFRDANNNNVTSLIVNTPNVTKYSKILDLTGVTNATFVLEGLQTNQSYNLTCELQLEKGEEKTSFTPYQDKDTYNIDLPVENLLKIPYYTSDGTYQGVTFTTNPDGSINVNGTATSTIYFNLLRDNNQEVLKNDATFTISGGNPNVELYFNGDNHFDTGQGVTWTYTSSITSTRIVGIRIQSGKTVNATIFPMLEVGTKVNTFTPYGTTPIEMCKIGDYKDEFRKRNGTNLLPLTDIATTTRSGVTYSIENQVLRLNGTASTGILIETEDVTVPAGTYYFTSIINNVGGSGSYARYITTKSGTNLKTNEGTITLEADTELHFRFYTNSGGVFNNATIYAILVQGSSATLWQPYGVGEWYKYKIIEKIVLDGVNNTFIFKHGGIKSDTKGFYQIRMTGKKSGGSSGNTEWGLSNYFKFVSGDAQNAFNNNSSGLWWEANTNYVYAILEQTSLENANTWLTTHNTSVYYILENPTGEPIPSTLNNQLEELYIAKSKENQTNISQVNNDLGFIISASALKKGDTIENNSASLLMSFGGLSNTNDEEETPDFEEDVSDVEEETPIEESIEEEIEEEPVEEETEIEEEGE